jgi:hypothetical protein
MDRRQFTEESPLLDYVTSPLNLGLYYANHLFLHRNPMVIRERHGGYIKSR